MNVLEILEDVAETMYEYRFDEQQEKLEAVIDYLEEKEENRKDMEYRILKNHTMILKRIEAKRQTNWIVVKNLLQQGTSKGGSTSSYEKCELLRINPDGYNLRRSHK